MAITNNLSATLTLNTLGGTNSPAPTDSFNSTVAIGTLAAGPMGVNVTTVATALPLAGASPAGPATAVYCLMVAHTGASTDNGIILDMVSSAGSSKITINPGGRVYFYNCTIAISGAGYADWNLWTLSVASGSTTASISLCYT